MSEGGPSSSDEYSSSPTDEYSVLRTTIGNKLLLYPRKIYIEGNNSIVVNNSKDVNIEVRHCDGSQGIFKSNPGEDNERDKPKSVKMELLKLCVYEETCEELSGEQNEKILQLIQKIEAMMRKQGGSLRSISSGSLVFNLSVQDSYALENLIESHKSGAFIRELAKIFASNEVEQFCKCWSTHIDEQTYTEALSELKIIEKNKSSIAEWNRGQVRDWLISEVELDKEIANKFYQEEVIGKNLLYTDNILQDFNLRDDLRMLQYSIKDERDKLLETSQLQNPVTRNCSPEMVSEFLLQMGIAPIHAEKFKNRKMSGKRFVRYEVEDLRHDFELPSGTLWLVQHLQELSRNEQMNPIVRSSETVPGMCEEVSSKISDNANLEKESSTIVEENLSTSKKKNQKKKSKNRPIQECSKLDEVPLEEKSKFRLGEHNSTIVDEIDSSPGHGRRTTAKNTNTMKIKPIQECSKLDEVTVTPLDEKSKFGLDEQHNVTCLPTEKQSGDGKEHLSRVPKNIISNAEATKRVRELLLGTQQVKERFDLMYSAILVVNEPDTNITPSDKEDWFSFVPKIQWKAIFDFDAASNEKGICQIMRDKQKVNMFYPEDVAHAKSPTEISYSEIPAWIFCNGRTDNDVNAMDKMSWIENQSQDMDNAVQFLSNSSVIRKGTALVVFLILSDNIEVMVEAFRKFFTDFGLLNIIFICENPEIFQKWCELAAKVCNPERLPERSIVGVPWSTLCSIIVQMQGVNVKSDFTLPTMDGKQCYLLERDISRLLDLSVVSYNECENTDMDEHHPDFDDFCNKRELEFYRGEKLDFWNFMLTEKGYDQVCPREIKNKLKNTVESNIRDAETLIHWIHLYHQPGSGGSTVARQVLWEFRKRYRCVILKRITDQTSSQIMEVWNYGERHGNSIRTCLPLIILSDNLGEDELHDMVIDLKNNTKHFTGCTCIILNCKRKSSLEEVKKSADTNTFILEHSLSEHEKAWFNRKYSQLEEKQKENKDISFQPDRLLAFMIMKEEFRKENIESIVQSVLKDIEEQDPNEFELVQYAALLSKYQRDSVIPVPCCDELMGYAFSSKHKAKISPWESRRSGASLLLMATVDIFDLGSVQGLKIVHPIVAEFIVKVSSLSQSLANLVKRYLLSKLHTTISSSRKYLNMQTHNLLIKRTKVNEANIKKQQYSSIILEITDVDKAAACDVLITGFNVLEDPIVAQQTARYYSYVMEDYEMALKFIEEAIEIKQYDSFLWDTKGQIYRQEILRSYYLKYVVNPDFLSISSSLELLDLAFKGIECFQMSQKMTLVDKTDNTSGFSNEVDLTFKLLDVLTRLDIFRNSSEGQQMLQQYLVDQHYRPAELGTWAQYHQKMKTLMGNVDSAMETMSAYLLTVQKEWSDSTSGISDELSRKFSYYVEMWKTHFGSIDTKQINWEMTTENTNELRRISARKLGAPQLRKMFDLANGGDIGVKSLVEIKKLLYQNKPYTAFDLQGILLANMALSSVVNKKKIPIDIPSMKTMIDIAKEFDQLDRKERKKSNLQSLYAPFYLLMMLWPRNQAKDECDDELMNKSLREIRERWSESKQHNDTQSADHPVYGTYQPFRRRTSKKPSVHFFLGCGKGLKALVHVSRISKAHLHVPERERIWESDKVQTNLLQVEGKLSSENTVDYKHGKNTININLAFPRYGKLPSREDVLFYIGFSWNGPVAYYVQFKSSLHLTQPVSHRIDHLPMIHQTHTRSARKTPFMSVLDYQNNHRKLVKTLSAITEIRNKLKQGEKLEKTQLYKLGKEQEIKEQRMELEENFRKQHDISQED